MAHLPRPLSGKEHSTLVSRCWVCLLVTLSRPLLLFHHPLSHPGLAIMLSLRTSLRSLPLLRLATVDQQLFQSLVLPGAPQQLPHPVWDPASLLQVSQTCRVWGWRGADKTEAWPQLSIVGTFLLPRASASPSTKGSNTFQTDLTGAQKAPGRAGWPKDCCYQNWVVPSEEGRARLKCPLPLL